MAGQTHRTKVGGVWIFQYAIPGDVRDALAARHSDYSGQKVIRRSLKTGDAREAERRARPLIDLWRSRVEAARGRNTTAADDVAEAVAKLRALGYVIAAPGDPMENWRRDEEGIPVPPTPPTADGVAAFAAFAARLEAKAAGSAVNFANRKLVAAGVPAPAAQAAAEAAGADRLLRAAEAATIAAGLTGEAPPSGAGMTMTALFERWKREARPTEGSIREAEYAVRKWGELHGDIDMSSVTKAHVRAFRDAMLDTPTRIPKDDQKLPLPDLLAKYEGADVSRSSVANATKKLTFIKTMFRVGVDAGLLEESPCEGIRITTAATDRPSSAGRQPLTRTEHVTLMQAIAEADREFAMIVRLGVYTGARLGEIIQLTSDDVGVEDGVTFINITAEAGKSVKTKSSIRRVPIHAELCDDLVAYAKSKNGKLFDVKPGRNGDKTDVIGKRFSYWRKTIGLTREGLCFHSLRHSLKDRAREAGIPEEIHDALTGHSGGGVGRSYGGKPPLVRLNEAIQLLRFPST
jgi:integrase